MADTDEILDKILIPRPNGSENLIQVGSYLKSYLSDAGAQVSVHTFTATPYGFQLMWLAAMLLMLAYIYFIFKQRYGLALLMCTVTPLLLLAEFEYLKSPVSGLLPVVQENIIGTYPGKEGVDTLIITAHYDTATHFGDHFSWGFWGKLQGPAQALAFILVIVGFVLKRKSREIPVKARLMTSVVIALPFAAMFWFQTIGPLVRTPSIGAIDNGGSMAAMLLLANKLNERQPDQAETTVKLVFISGEEERTLGSWAYAEYLSQGKNPEKIKVINLESIGASDELAYIVEDGFATRRYRSSNEIIGFVNQAAEKYFGSSLKERALPFGTLTDGRSFLAHNIEAITLRSFIGDQFPRRLHSKFDSRDRLSVTGIDESAGFIFELINTNPN